MNSWRVFVACFALATVFAALPAGPAAAEEPPEIEYGAFKQAFYDQVGGKLDSALADAQARLDGGDLPDHERERLEAEKAELTRLKAQVEDVKTVEALYSSVKDGMKAIDDLSKEVETGFKDSAVNLGSLTVKDLKAMSGLQRLSLVSKGADAAYDYYGKIKALSEDLQAIDDTNLSPSARRLAGSLSAMTALMSGFGDKVPLIGAFVKGYGDVGGGLLKATLALDEKLLAAEGGEMIDGVHGSRKEMLDRLREKGIDSAQRVEGMRDVYVGAGGKVLLWDSAARDWAVASDVEPGITPAELLRRYRHYAGRGIKNPSAEQLLRGYSRTVVIGLEASATVVEPGQSVTLVPTARLVKDDRPVGGGLWVTVVEQSHTGFGSGSFSGQTTVRLGQKVTWTAPNNVGETYVLAADLAEESKKVASSTGPGTARVRTGAATRVTLEARPASVAAGAEVELLAQVSDAEGAPLPASAAGSFSFSAAPEQGRFGGYRSLQENKGVSQSWRAPEKPGRYTLTVAYSGAGKSGLLGTHQAGSTASVAVEVRPADFELSVDAASKPATKEAPAVFTVTLHNRDAAPRRFALQARSGPGGQLSQWRGSTGELSGAVEVPGGQTKSFSVSLAPASDKATRLSVRASATPVGSGEGKSVEFAAEARQESKAVKVAVAASGKDGKAQVAGGASHQATVEPGAKLSLSFQPWGTRRQYCTKDVVERNRNMKMVVLFSHGPKGCSFGTEDGRMHSEWKVTEEKISWSGPGVVARPGSESAEFTVPEEPGTYTVSATGSVSWAYERRTPAGLTRQSETESSSGSFTITVRKP